MTQYEREEAQLEQDLASGRITRADHDQQVCEMEASYRAEAKDAAWAAFDNELNNW